VATTKRPTLLLAVEGPVLKTLNFIRVESSVGRGVPFPVEWPKAD
jgi:hypothetical protein